MDDGKKKQKIDKKKSQKCKIRNKHLIREVHSIKTWGRERLTTDWGTVEREGV